MNARSAEPGTWLGLQLAGTFQLPPKGLIQTMSVAQAALGGPSRAAIKAVRRKHITRSVRSVPANRRFTQIILRWIEWIEYIVASDGSGDPNEHLNAAVEPAG